KAETDENNVKIINSPEKGGYGIDAQWMDDFHHVIHSVLTGEKEGYYQDYGRLEDLEKVFKNFLYTGEYSHFWQKKRGTDASANPGRQFVVCLQNHDQVGNRGRGERLSLLVDFPFLKAAAGLLFMTPYIPLLFMGEEYAEKKPFLFFTDYIDQKLKKAVSEGRKEEFKGFNWDVFPDPEDDASFFNSRLTPEAEWKEENKKILNFYKDLIALRKKHPALHFLDKDNTQVKVNGRVVEVSRRQKDKKIVGIFNLGDGEISLKSFSGKQILNSAWEKYGGSLQGSADFLGRGEMVLLEQHAE
ncbi:MAG: DUF3459 domain-containing protein, partial [Firmicutes bacterium]|nr:DUF3459 domain-containing protein [Bacillota bacterium]